MRVRDRLRTIYSGWWVLLGVTLLGIMSGGILYHGAAVFFNPIRRDLNLSSANTSLIFTLSRAQSSLAAPLYGWLVDHFGPRPLIVLGAIVASVGLVAITLTDNYILFLIAYLLLVSVPTNFGFGPTLMAAANGWFVRRKAIAMTILLTGIARRRRDIHLPARLGGSHHRLASHAHLLRHLRTGIRAALLAPRPQPARPSGRDRAIHPNRV